MRDCKRCGGEVSWTHDTSELFGGVYVHLCNDCRNEWSRAMKADPLWAEHMTLEARQAHYNSLAHARQPVAESDWADVAARGDAVRRRAFELGMAFIQPARKPKRATKSAAESAAESAD